MTELSSKQEEQLTDIARQNICNGRPYTWYNERTYSFECIICDWEPFNRVEIAKWSKKYSPTKKALRLLNEHGLAHLQTREED